MLAFELQKVAEVLGAGKEIEKIKKKEVFVERNGKVELFEGKVIGEEDFPGDFLPEIIFLATKNPVGPIVKYYYQKIKEKGYPLPSLVLSQNGISAGHDSLFALREIFGKEAEKIQIIRVSLFNPVEKKEIDGKIYISYSLPIYLSFGVFLGPRETAKLKDIFKKAKIEAQEVPPERVRDMEFSKLFLNLIGIPSALKELSIKEGFENPEIFKEEIEALKEYIKVVKAKKSNFLNFKKAPIRLLANLISFLPFPILNLFRKKLGKLTEGKRRGKPKGNLDEIDYYNGAVVELGKKLGIPTPVNEAILQKAKEFLERYRSGHNGAVSKIAVP